MPILEFDFDSHSFPLALLLTHRRGAAVAIFKSIGIFKQINQQNLGHYFSLLTQHDAFDFTLPNSSGDTCQAIPIKDQAIFLRVLGKTAENLCDLYRYGLKHMGLQNDQIKAIAVGIGPGSFTGLRLGCAFANGLSLGTDVPLLPLPTLLISDMIAWIASSAQEYESAFLAQLGDHSLEDDSTGYLTFFDLIQAIFHMSQGNEIHFVDTLVPKYARDPGPVLKLKGTHL